jgi:acyl-CoA synthetase (AMP-forming)/AMP-acid ligase II
MRLHDCLTRAARIWPDRVAVRDEHAVRTWREVCDDVSRLAVGLRTLGISPGDRIALLGANSARYLDCFFAASWAGAVLVPLNTRLADAELTACLRDSGAALLLAGDGCTAQAERLAAAWPGLRGIVHLGADPGPGHAIGYEALVGESEPGRPAGGDGRVAAGIFYTGGTTGTPKGVVLSHDNLLANAWHILPALGWSQDTVFLHAAPMFHLADVCCLVAVSAVAGQHVVIPGFAPDALTGAVGASRVTALGLVPTMISALVNTPGLAGRDLSSVTSILYGGSPMRTELITQIRHALPRARLWQAYGQTEAAPVLTLLPPADHEPGPASKAGSAGVPVPGCEIAIHDPVTDMELPSGQTGEICGRGDNVMTGYWNQPELSARALRNGWLHTGDAGHLDDDGYLHVTGRIIDMIITGGENVYPAEVENVLCQHPAVAEAAVLGLPDGRWGQRVHAVVAARPGGRLEPAEVIAFCRAQLAGYKCPRSIEVQDALPKTGVGKIDKRALASAACHADRPS